MARTAHRKKSEADTKDESQTRIRASRGAARGIWTGSISFGLLQIPVTIYPAESRADELHFRMLDKRDLSPVRYERVSSTTGKPVEWKDIVKGFELAKDEFVVIEPEDFAKANVKASQTIDIQDFVPGDQIDPAFFETPYYLIPNKRATKAYFLLRETLAKKSAVAIATFVLRTREHLVAIMPSAEGEEPCLMLEILRFGHELKDSGDLPIPSPSDDLSSRELAMAEQLVEGMMTDWDPSKYKDRFYRDMMKVIDEKAKTGAVKEHHAKTTGTVANDVVDLLDLLKKSVAKAGTAAAPKKPLRKARHRRAEGEKGAA